MARQDRATACTRDRESVVGLHRARLRARAARCARHEGHMHTTWCPCATTRAYSLFTTIYTCPCQRERVTSPLESRDSLRLGADGPRPLRTGDGRHGRGCERCRCSDRPTARPCAAQGASRRRTNHEISAPRLLFGWGGVPGVPSTRSSAVSLGDLSQDRRPWERRSRRQMIGPPHPQTLHMHLRYFSCVFLKDMVLDNDDDHEPALEFSRSRRLRVRIVHDERSRFGDVFFYALPPL